MGFTELQAWNGGCAKGSRANAGHEVTPSSKQCLWALHLPGLQPKSAAVAPLWLSCPRSTQGHQQVWPGRKKPQESPLAEACRVGRSHQFAVLAPNLPKGSPNRREGHGSAEALEAGLGISSPLASRSHSCMTSVIPNPKQQTSNPRHQVRLPLEIHVFPCCYFVRTHYHSVKY